MPPSLPSYQSRREESDNVRLACEACKRRKTKCNRVTPLCDACAKLGRQCVYPSQAGKPGPKPGWRKRKTPPTPENAAGTRPAMDTSSVTVLQAPLPSMAIPQSSPSLTESTTQSARLGAALEWSSTQDPTETPQHAGEGGSPRQHRGSVGQGNNLPRWAWIFHPDHDTLLVENPCNSPEMTHATSHEEILGLDSATIHHLTEVYLENMTALSLFHLPTFWKKLDGIPQPKVRAALFAAMFSFSTRYTPAPAGFSSQIFHDMAYKIATDALDDYGDSPPCVHLSQSAVLISFFELADGVRGKAWRTLGQTIRCALEIKQNAVDANTTWPPESVESWILQEERRRLFWALWEFDVFAGTIRRAPSAIDWRTCRTMLPVSDEDFYAGRPQKSCFLHPDPFRRLKDLKASGNEGGRAWFIVINSFMREAHLFTEQLYVPEILPKPTNPYQQIPPQLEILENAATCFKMTLPQNLECTESLFEYDTRTGTVEQRSSDALRYSIYAMQQLTQMMIHRHACVGSISRSDFEQMLKGGSIQDANSLPLSNDTRNSRRYSWGRFKNAAENVVRLARYCPAHHVQSVSPFLASTIWIAAAALVTCEIFAGTKVEGDAARSKVEVLRLLLDHYASFWKSTNSLVYRLVLVRSSLKRMCHRSESRNVTPPDTPTSEMLPSEAMNTTQLGTTAPVLPRPSSHHPTPRLAVYPDSLGESENTLSLADWLLEPPSADGMLPDFDPNISLDAYGTFDLDQFIMSITSGGDMGSMDLEV